MAQRKNAYLKGLLELVVRTRRDLVILEIFLSVEINLLSLDLAIFHVDL